MDGPLSPSCGHQAEPVTFAFLNFSFFLSFFFFVFLGPHLQHMEVPRLGVESEL